MAKTAKRKTRPKTLIDDVAARRVESKRLLKTALRQEKEILSLTKAIARARQRADVALSTLARNVIDRVGGLQQSLLPSDHAAEVT